MSILKNEEDVAELEVLGEGEAEYINGESHPDLFYKGSIVLS